MEENKTLLVVDDHPMVLEGMESLLGSDGFKILKASTAREAIDIAKHHPETDVYVVDMSLAGRSDGLDLAARLRKECGEHPVVVYTMHDEPWNIALLRDSGAEGIVMKSDDLVEIREAVRAVARGGIYRSPEFAKRSAEVPDAAGLLTDIDIAVLRGIAAGKSARDIADSICRDKKTVEYHSKKIREKLGVATTPQAVARAIHLGLLV